MILCSDLRAPTHIDYLSLDVEGAETVAMSTVLPPNGKYSFGVISIERPQKDLKDQL